MTNAEMFSGRLTYFLRCAEATSLTEAASQLGVTQPALSLAMSQLETELGERLFHRKPRGIELTAKGRALAELVRHSQRRFRDDIAEVLGTDDATVLRVGAVVHFGLRHLIPVLEAQRAQLPRIQLGITWSLPSMEAVRSGRLDFAFVAWTSRPRGVEYVQVREDPSMILGLRSKFARIAKARSYKDLADLPWIAQPKPQVDWTRSLDHVREGYTVRDAHALRELVLTGRGIGDLQVDIFSDAEKRQLAFARHVPSRYASAHIYAVYREDIRSAAKGCLDQLLETLKPARRSTTSRRRGR